MKKSIKKVLMYTSFLYWKSKCKFAYLLEGSHGFARIISLLPKMHIVPILKCFGAQIGNNCDIDLGLMLHRVELPLKNLILSRNTHLGHRVFIDLTEKVSIQEDTAIGSYTMFITHTGDQTNGKTDYYEFRKGIEIGRSVIIYSSCIVCPGVSVGDFSRIGANSTILRDIPSKYFAAGSPAILKKIINS